MGVQIVWEGELRREDIVAQIKEDAGLLPDDMFYLVDAVRPPPLVLCTPTTTHSTRWDGAGVRQRVLRDTRWH